ncbi:MAG TPA: ABC transporter permease, partial [Chitinophagales bacterium]|nr:ABC transporter permease [Chitinophagales bacterium]
MLKNYFKVAIRSLRKNKLYSFINIAGLTLGIASCILIGLYIHDEINYDRFHANGERIVRATMEYSSAGTVNQVATTGTKVGPQLKRVFPAIEEFTRTYKATRVVSYEGKQFEEKNVLYADSSFLKVFSFPLLQGSTATALNNIGKVVITSDIAKKYFGSEEAIGKTLQIGNNAIFEVTGVAAAVPGNSQIQFDFLASFNNLDVSKSEEWFTANYITYFLLHDKDHLAMVQQQVNAYMLTDVKKELNFEGGDYLIYNLQRFTEVHLHSSLEGFEPNGNITYLYILGIIALLILAIACVNYTNLAIAQFSGRSGEIGIRKVMGAIRSQLFAQFIGESIFLSVIALMLAVVVSIQLLPVSNAITGKHFSAGILFQPITISMIVLLGLLIGLMAGAYPALILSNTGIIKILKSGFSFSTSGGTVKKSLIVFQFVISIFLITSTIIILQQLSFIRNKNLGYDKTRIVVVPVDGKMRGE